MLHLTGANVRKSEAKAQRQGWRRTAGKVIAASRKDADLTQDALAKRVGWSRNTLASVERGRGKVEFGDVVMIARALSERPDTLIRRILMWN